MPRVPGRVWVVVELNGSTTRYVPMDDRWLALLVAIICDMTPDKAMARVGHPYERKEKRSYTEDEITHMMELKDSGMTYKQVGAVFGISDHRVFNAIRRGKK